MWVVGLSARCAISCNSEYGVIYSLLMFFWMLVVIILCKRTRVCVLL